MSYDRARIERLQAEIASKRIVLAEERAALDKLQNEIGAFAQRYDRIIGPLESQLDAIQQQIEALQSRTVANQRDHDSLWGPEYATFEESFDAKYRGTQNSMITAPRRPVDEQGLRTLYRKLARKFHPDTTTDPKEKARLTIIMAQVNAAYRAKNMDELLALDGQRVRSQKANPPVVPQSQPAAPSYLEWLKVVEGLNNEIAWLRSEYSRLMASPLMSLKIETAIARSQGRDLLREIASRVRADLDAAKSQLAALR
jgi:hypothetical protein